MLNSPAFALVILLFLGMARPVFAQEQLFRTVKATAGKPLRLALIANLKRDCTAGPMPDVRVLTPPTRGTLAIRSGKLKAGSLKRCPELEVQVQGVFYQANRGLSGNDAVVFEVKRPDGTTHLVTLKIEISPQQAPATIPHEGIEL
jgi:hypothetical protein